MRYIIRPNLNKVYAENISSKLILIYRLIFSLCAINHLPISHYAGYFSNQKESISLDIWFKRYTVFNFDLYKV